MPLSVQFTDSSTGEGITSRNWYFGDGGTNLTATNPIYLYSGWIGNNTTAYNVSLNTTNPSGSDWENKTGYITVYPVLNTISVNDTTANTTQILQFNNTVSNGTATVFDWDWGDGTAHGTIQNATHQYIAAGTYSVTSNVSNAYSYNWSRNTNWITVTAPPVADFSADDTSIISGDTVTFADLSTNAPTSWAWSWGDGTANGTTQNPTHQYSADGVYTVILTATNTAGSDTEEKVDYITVATPTPTPTPTPTGTAFPHRIMATGTIEPLDETGYTRMMGFMGTENNTTPINFSAALDGLSYPLGSSPIGPLAYVIALAIPIVMIWIFTDKAYIPLILGMLLAGGAFAMGWIPADYAMPIIAFIGISITGILVSLWRGWR